MNFSRATLLIENTHHRLRVAILSTHCEIQAERVAVDDINVARFRPAQGINPSTEGLVGVDVNHNSRVFAMNTDCNGDMRVNLRSRFYKREFYRHSMFQWDRN